MYVEGSIKTSTSTDAQGISRRFTKIHVKGSSALIASFTISLINIIVILDGLVIVKRAESRDIATDESPAEDDDLF